MYLFFRVLSLVAFLLLLSAVVLKLLHSPLAHHLLNGGVVVAYLTYLGKKYWDYRRQSRQMA